MTIFIASLAAALFMGVPTILAMAACMRSGQLSRDDETAAPEGYIPHFVVAADKREAR